MNDTLKAAGRIGAELGAAKAENEKLRGLVRRYVDLFADVRLAGQAKLLDAEARAALFQQAEPECRCTMRERVVGDGCSVCNPELAAELSAADEDDEPAQAQDEREAFKRALHSQRVFKLSSATINAAEWAWFHRTAQTEQPEQEPFWYAVVSEQAPTINSAIKRLDVAQEFADSKREYWPDTRVVPLYTAPQPEQSGLVDALRTEALGLCDVVEKINSLSPVAYALQAGRAINKVRDAAAALSAQWTAEQ